VPQDCLDDLGLFYNAAYFHFLRAFRAGEWINLIDFLNQPRPSFAARRGDVAGLYNAWDFVIPVFLLSIAPEDITVVAIP